VQCTPELSGLQQRLEGPSPQGLWASKFFGG
jgi:hypothetical protein